MFKKNILLAFTVVCANASASMDDNQQIAIFTKLTSDISLRQNQQNEKNSVSVSVAAIRSKFENTSTETDQNTKKPLVVSTAAIANPGRVAAIRSIFEKNESKLLSELEKQALQAKANASADETIERDSIHQSQQEKMNQILAEKAAITTLKNNLSYLADLFCKHFSNKQKDNNSNIDAIIKLLTAKDSIGDIYVKRMERLNTLKAEKTSIDAELQYASTLKNIAELSRDKCLDLSKKYLSTLKEMLQTIETSIDFHSRTEENERLFAKELPKEIANRDQLRLLIRAAEIFRQ